MTYNQVYGGSTTMSILKGIKKPTMLLNETIARSNIKTMQEKAQQNNVLLRPHFKTHQSAVVGEWFRQAGTTAITVSSLDMAAYFAQNGWMDIIVAFPVNILEIQEINELAARIDLGLLVESFEVVDYLQKNLKHAVKSWIKIDSGSHRTGLPWQDTATINRLASHIMRTSNLHLQGILTHAGETYHASSPDEIRRLFAQSALRMDQVRDSLKKDGITDIQISVGDTPGAMLSRSFSNVDEIRPGNYVFFDAMQLNLGSCKEKDIAMVVTCPLVANHPERNEAIIYGGAVHFSKDTFSQDGINKYGLVVSLHDRGWGRSIPAAYLKGVSQEHGIVSLPAEVINQYSIGDLIGIVPAHSCLTIDLLQDYRTLSGEVIHTLYSQYSKSGLT